MSVEPGVRPGKVRVCSQVRVGEAGEIASTVWPRTGGQMDRQTPCHTLT